MAARVLDVGSSELTMVARWTLAVLVLLAMSMAAAAAASAVLQAAGAGALPTTCDGQPNTHAVLDAALVSAKTVPNGALYSMPVGGADSTLFVAHLYGSAYDMGKAHGELFKDVLPAFLDDVYTYIYAQVDAVIHELPDFLRQMIEKYGVEAALDYTALVTRPYTPQHFFDEMQGLADGAGVPLSRVRGMQMFPELIKAACSMFGAWGPAVSQVPNATLVQLRALDWSTDGPFQRYATVFVHHPTDGHAFTSLSFAGFIGALTGMSSSEVGICEKVWIHYNGTSVRDGYPWHFLLRDILQYDQTLNDALSRIESARRTCSIFAGVGDAKQPTFRAVEYAHDYAIVLNDQNYPEYPAHPRFDGLVYIDKHTQPSNDQCLGDLMKTFYGQLSPQNTLQYVTAMLQTGNLHIAIMDFAAMDMYVATATPGDGHGHNVTNAYDRPFVRLPVGQLMQQAQ